MQVFFVALVTTDPRAGVLVARDLSVLFMRVVDQQRRRDAPGLDAERQRGVRTACTATRHVPRARTRTLARSPSASPLRSPTTSRATARHPSGPPHRTDSSALPRTFPPRPQDATRPMSLRKRRRRRSRGAPSTSGAAAQCSRTSRRPDKRGPRSRGSAAERSVKCSASQNAHRHHEPLRE
jgi:hypothetical protein